jgi:outer membrane protein OmpA-like peptidoglycan-associated protein
MTRLKAALLCALAAPLLVTQAGAQITGHPIEISAGAGLAHYDVRAYTHDAPAFGGSLGWRFAPWLSLEGAGLYSSSTRDSGTASEAKRSFYWAGADLRWNLRPADGRALPFLLTGFGYGKSHREGLDPTDLERGSARVGLGLLVKLTEQRTFLRFQATDQMFKERDQRQFLNELGVTAGLQFVLGGKARDVDHDGVRDWLDKCPDTPIGAKVDANGCPIDSDHDSVFDGLDKCPDTPPGCKVDANGCSSDADGDGVCDGVDTCPDTPKGATVDAKGCPSDTDGDGVLDGLDQCPGTPKGCTVDAKGCPSDADGDGVCDGLDQCANTPAGLRVTATGCPIEVNEKETQLLDTGTIRLGSIQFDTGKSTLKPESFAIIDTVALILQQYPTLKIEIGGHTDNKGTAAKNQVLSEARAKAVLDYLRGKVAGFDSLGYSSKGYGFSRPVAPNTTALGRSKNRRVEFKVLNTEALRIEREKRRYLRKDEGMPPPVQTPPPAPAPAPPDSTQH